MNNEISTPEVETAHTGLREVAAKMVARLGSEATSGIFLTLTTALLGLDKGDSTTVAKFLRDLADEVEACEKPIDPIELN